MTVLSRGELRERAELLMPGGVSSPVRAFRAVGGEPPFIVSGSGARVRDVDGREYIDLVCSWGPLIAGHAHPAVVAALSGQIARGTSFGLPTPGEVELAERISHAMPAIEMVRFVSSGTEATMSALRLARAARASPSSSAAPQVSSRAYAWPTSRSSVATPAAMASGFPESVPA